MIQLSPGHYGTVTMMVAAAGGTGPDCKVISMRREH